MTQPATSTASPFQFVEEAPWESGFAEIFDADVAPHLPVLEQRWRMAAQRRWTKLSVGAALIVAIWGGLWATGLYQNTIALFAAGLTSLVVFDLLLRRTYGDRESPARRMRELLIQAVCHRVEGLTYQTIAGRRINSDRFVFMRLIPAHDTLVTGDFFSGERQDLIFRAVEVDIRSQGRTCIFRGLLVEIETGRETGAPTAILQHTSTSPQHDDEKALEISGHPAFRHLYRVRADDPDDALGLLSDSMMTALTRLPEQLHDAAVQIGFMAGTMMIAVPLPDDPRDATSPPERRFDPVGDARLMLKQVMMPASIIDTMHGIDPDTGGRYRAR
tara:strand:- start:16085 stop:17077 length:993 start_codon:yes stop_codon:yes gene_type:complete